MELRNIGRNASFAFFGVGVEDPGEGERGFAYLGRLGLVSVCSLHQFGVRDGEKGRREVVGLPIDVTLRHGACVEEESAH